jgi:hypothetical protein
VLSGGTQLDDLLHFAYRPDKIVDSIADLDHNALAREFGKLNAAVLPDEPQHRTRRPGRTMV